ncbi:MAG TPA: sucrase ferredoxin [Actinomycetota bacterium]|nr:sucrase ferredoxin [Actinomycetota bacterium]
MTDAQERQRCGAIARESGEPLFATAPLSKAWLLIEHPGPWGADALTGSSVDSKVSAELDRRSKEHGFRILFLRRSGGSSSGSRSCFLARAAQCEYWMERLEIDGPGDLLDVDPGVLGRPAAPGLGKPAESFFAVCTHGRRDPCCAEYGRRLVRSFQTTAGDAEGVWESSHQGGHRFAANLALFPHGLFYGQVTPESAGRILESFKDGRLVLDGYRGRSAFDATTQAADYMVRRELGLTGIDDLLPTGKKDLGRGRYRVAFNGAMGALSVTLEESDGPMRPESCNKPKLTPVRLYRQLDLTPDVGESPTF